MGLWIRSLLMPLHLLKFKWDENLKGSVTMGQQLMILWQPGESLVNPGVIGNGSSSAANLFVSRTSHVCCCFSLSSLLLDVDNDSDLDWMGVHTSRTPDLYINTVAKNDVPTRVLQLSVQNPNGVPMFGVAVLFSVGVSYYRQLAFVEYVICFAWEEICQLSVPHLSFVLS